MSWKTTAQETTYRDALEAVATLGEPPVGFTKLSEVPAVVRNGLEVLIKQNNLLIQLLVKQGIEIEKLQEEIRIPMARKIQQDNLAGPLAAIELQLKELQLGSSRLVHPSVKQKIYVHKDPQKIFEEELSKLK